MSISVYTLVLCQGVQNFFIMKDLKAHASKHFLETNYTGHLSYIWKNKPYVIPITYYFDPKENCILSYSCEGHKIDAMRINNAISIGISDIKSLQHWKSILVHGKFEELSGSHAKQQLHKLTDGIKRISSIKDEKNLQIISDFSCKTESNGLPIVYRIKVLEITGKYRNP